MYAELKQKVCPKCKTMKPYSEFHKDRTASNGMCPSCKACKCNSKNGRYKKDTRVRERKDYNHKRNLKRFYKMTVDQYAEMFRNQEGKCKVCGTSQDLCKRKFSVDHDHETGQIRHLLCDNCNLGLGNFKDSEKLLELAVQYLRSFRTKG